MRLVPRDTRELSQSGRDPVQWKARSTRSYYNANVKRVLYLSARGNTEVTPSHPDDEATSI